MTDSGPPDEEARAHRVLSEQVALMCRLTTSPLAGSVVVGAMLAWLTAPVRGAAASMAWYVVLLAVVGLRWRVARRYLARPRDDLQTRRWRAWMLALAALGGAVWSVSGTWLLPLDSPRETIVAVLFIGATASGLNTQAPVRHAYAALLVPFVLPFALHQLALGEDRIIVGLAFLLYIPVMIVIANRQTDAIERQIRLTMENQALVAALQHEQQRVEQANRRLHNQVEEQKFSAQRIRALNRELEKQMAELRTANQDLEGFSYSVSHDLRAPLRAIDGFAKLLEEQHQMGESSARHYLARIRVNTSRMAALIDDLLAFARCGRQTIDSCELDMHQLATQALEEVRSAHPLERDAAVTIHPLPGARGDRELLRQVWVNLLDNAIKYSSKAEQPRIVVSGREENGRVVFEIEDNGIGFDAAHSEKLFGVFQRLHGNREYPGTGVGLAIVQRIVTRHGGRVWASSAPGQGARFRFSLPIGAGGEVAMAS